MLAMVAVGYGLCAITWPRRTISTQPGPILQTLRDFAAVIHEKVGMYLVLAVFFALIVFAHHSAGIPNETKFEDFCITKSGEALACFFGLITGARLATNGNGHAETKEVSKTITEKTVTSPPPDPADPGPKTWGAK